MDLINYFNTTISKIIYNAATYLYFDDYSRQYILEKVIYYIIMYINMYAHIASMINMSHKNIP